MKGQKRAVVAVPHSLDEAAKFVARLGQEQREIDRINLALNEKLKDLTAKATAEAKPYQESIAEIVGGLFAFAESRREELTDGGQKKTVELPTGIFGWRMTPPAISLREVKEVLVRLKTMGLTQFVRTKEEVDKEAMLKEPELAKSVKGVSITQHEDFLVKPKELTAEIAVKVSKLKEKVV